MADDLEAAVVRIFAILQARGESIGPILALLKQEAELRDKVLRKLLRTKPATEATWAEFQMAQGAVAALNDLYLRIDGLAHPAPPQRKRPPDSLVD